MPACRACGVQNPEGFNFCGACAAPLTAGGSGQRKTVSILMCDLVGSTALGSSVDTEVLHPVLTAYWELARSVVERHGGTVEKFIGDAVVGVFGLPVIHEDDALRAVRAASDLVAELHDLNQNLQVRLGIELAVRIGVNTGEVLAGVGGEALMSGDPANVAARLEQAAGTGEVLLSESTHWLVRDAVDVEQLGPLLVKGKADPLVAFRLLGVRPQRVGPGRGRRFTGPLVGRARQLRLAETAYETATEERACLLLTVIGEPGVGKSRLVEELLARIGDEALVLSGRCLPYGEGITYWPTVEMLNRLSEGDPRPWSAWLAGVDHADQIAVALDTMLGRVQAATGKEIAWAFRRLIETLTAERPVVLVVDDLQWAEQTLLDLLDHVTDMSRGSPILLVCMARPEFQQQRPTWGAQRSHSFTTVLTPLSPTDCEELTLGLLGTGVDDQLLERIAAASEGIPLFVEEMLAMLVDQGRLVANGAHGWTAPSNLDDVTMPATVQALLAARLDRLEPQLLDALQAAAVIGQTFYPDALTALLDEPGDLELRTEALVRADLIAPTATDLPGHDAYAFTHLLTRDAAYQALPMARRAILHEDLARWLAASTRDAVVLDVRAFHLEQAAIYSAQLGHPAQELAEDAAQLLLAAADRALAQWDPAAALGLAGRAASLVPADSALRAEIALLQSNAAIEVGDLPAASRWADEAERTAKALADDALQWRARVARCEVQLMSDPSLRVDDILSLMQQAIEALGAAGDELGLTMAFGVRAAAHHLLGREWAAAADAKEGLKHARQADRASGNLLNLIVWVTMPFGAGNGSLPDYERALDEIRRDYGDEPGVGQFLDAQHTFLLAYQGRLEEATGEMREKYRLALEKGAVAEVMLWSGWGVGWCQQWAGDLGAAAESMKAADQTLERAGETANRSTFLAQLAMFLVQLSRDEEAVAALEKSRAISQPNDMINQIRYAATEGLLLAHRGDSDASEARFAEGARLAATTEFTENEGELWLARSLARETSKDLPGALAAARQALACFEQKQFVPPIRVGRARIAELGG